MWKADFASTGERQRLCHSFDLYNMFPSDVQLCTVQGRNETTEPGLTAPPTPRWSCPSAATAANAASTGPLRGGGSSGARPVAKDFDTNIRTDN